MKSKQQMSLRRGKKSAGCRKSKGSPVVCPSKEEASGSQRVRQLHAKRASVAGLTRSMSLLLEPGDEAGNRERLRENSAGVGTRSRGSASLGCGRGGRLADRRSPGWSSRDRGSGLGTRGRRSTRASAVPHRWTGNLVALEAIVDVT